MDERVDNAGATPGAGEPRADGPTDEAAEVVDAEIVDAEVVEEAPTPEAPPEGGEGEAESPQESELEVARRERDEYLELAQRARADLENYRRRVSGEAALAERRGRAAVARDLLGALDNLERALLAAGVDPDGSTEAPAEPQSQEVSAQTALAEGVALVYRELREGLRRAGVEAFDPAGEKFDPNHHEAIATGNGGDGARGTVLETLEKGYTLGETVLRPARVVVAE